MEGNITQLQAQLYHEIRNETPAPKEFIPKLDELRQGYFTELCLLQQSGSKENYYAELDHIRIKLILDNEMNANNLF